MLFHFNMKRENGRKAVKHQLWFLPVKVFRQLQSCVKIVSIVMPTDTKKKKILLLFYTQLKWQQ